MGYTTTFTGHVTIDPPLNPHEIRYLERYAGTRHEHRTKGPFLLTDTGDPVPGTRGWADPFPGLPGYWCKWVPVENGSAIQWNEVEKFYDADKWMAYLIDTFLKPGATIAQVSEWDYPSDFSHFTFDHVVNGTIEAEGEEPDDVWRLEVRDNAVYTVHLMVQPEYGDVDPADLDDWGDAQWTRFAALTRRNVAFRVLDGEVREVDPADGITFDPIQQRA